MLRCGLFRSYSSSGSGSRTFPGSPVSPHVFAYVPRILTARVYDSAIESPLSPLASISKRLGKPVFLKREDLQPIHSFKLRGAANKIASLLAAPNAAEVRAKGVYAASAGNHAQGVALAARSLNHRSTLYMPEMTPSIKIRAVESLGANVKLIGQDFQSAAEFCEREATLNGIPLVHPYDDPLVIAGQGTIGVEILRQIQAAHITPNRSNWVNWRKMGSLTALALVKLCWVRYLFQLVVVV
jgi:threonine dehydratase